MQKNCANGKNTFKKNGDVHCSPEKAHQTLEEISFVVMQREGITEALTGDHRFNQAGYTALLRP